MRWIMFAVLVAGLALSGCHADRRDRVLPTADAMGGIKTLELQDKTDPLLLKATEAGMVAELTEIALTGKGYAVCKSPCMADATATVAVTNYARRVSENKMTGSARPTSDIAFKFQIHDSAGLLVMNLLVKKSDHYAQSDLTVKAVQTLASYIPEAAKR